MFYEIFPLLQPFMPNFRHSVAHKAPLLQSPPPYSWAFPSLSDTSRRWAAFSIRFVGCLQVLYLGMFGQYSLAFGPLCSHTINNKPSSQGDVCAFVVILLKQVHTCWALFGQQRFPHLLLIDTFSSQFFFVCFLFNEAKPTHVVSEFEWKFGFKVKSLLRCLWDTR